jgi:hypothetical protein
MPTGALNSSLHSEIAAPQLLMTEGNTSTKAAIEQASRLMKNGCECFDKLSMHGISSGNSSLVRSS